MDRTGPILDEVRTHAEALARQAVIGIEPVHRGGNNTLFRVDTDSAVFALKYYRRDSQDPRDRLATECQALDFLHDHGITSVPRRYEADQSVGCALLEWIEGTPVQTPVRDDLDTVANFVAHLSELSREASAIDLPLASEACLSTAATAMQIRERANRLKQVCVDRELERFLGQEFGPATDRLIPDAIDRAGRLAEGDVTLPPEAQTLSPSDLGFHNTLRSASGELIFLDFEYFGRDNPVKLVADFVLHPGNNLTEVQRRNFVNAASTIFAGCPEFPDRLRIALPLFALRWCMIMLNVFLEVQADTRTSERPRRRDPMAQLEKARHMLVHAEQLDQELADVA